MRFGGPLPWTGPISTPQNLLTVARAVEDWGYEWVTAGEYLLYPKSRPSPMPGGPMPVDPSQHEQEILTLFSWLAGQTTTLRFQTGMLILGYRSPFVAAKQIATLDYLSGGRFVLGVSAGWMKDEFDIFHVPFDRRGRVLDESLAIITELFGDGGPFEGEFYSFPASWFEPKPVQRPLPIVIGGGPVPAVLERVARFGDVWNPWGCGLRKIGETLPLLRQMREKTGRSPECGVQTYLPVNRDPRVGPVATRDELLARVGKLAAGGITQLTISVGELGGIGTPDPTSLLEIVLDTAQWFASEIMPEFQ
jgi:probable F420-dependent oxidoreductase